MINQKKGCVEWGPGGISFRLGTLSSIADPQKWQIWYVVNRLPDGNSLPRYRPQAGIPRSPNRQSLPRHAWPLLVSLLQQGTGRFQVFPGQGIVTIQFNRFLEMLDRFRQAPLGSQHLAQRIVGFDKIGLALGRLAK